MPQLLSTSPLPVRKRRWAFFAPLIALVLGMSVVAVLRTARGESGALVASSAWFAVGMGVFGLYLWSLRRSVRKLRALLIEGNPGLQVIVVRSSGALRGLARELTGRTIPRRAILGAYLVVVHNENRLDVWRLSRGGRPAVVLKVPWRVITSVTTGYVEYPDADERAIMLSGHVHGKEFELGLPPQNIDGWIPRAATDDEFAALLDTLWLAQERSPRGAM